ncbi:MAG: FAD-binding protein, partial [Candidatus Eisenbacteria bacterium]|nr:FAD-binding protein [Candidatus Eisenbacteria bacterium]
VLPKAPQEVSETVRLLDREGVPIVPRGAGTSLSGGCLSPEGGVVLSLTRMNQIEHLDRDNRCALVQAGVINLALSKAASPAGLHYAPDPSSQQACTLGGNIAANSGGPHTLKYGVTVNHVLAVELVTAGGERFWIGSRTPGRGGPDLVGTVVGHEGTFGVVTRAWVQLVPNPSATATFFAEFESVDAASKAVSTVIGLGVVPAAVEMMDAPIMEALSEAYGLSFQPGTQAALLIELDGQPVDVREDTPSVLEACQAAGASHVRQAKDESERRLLWKARKLAFGALGRITKNLCTQDGVVPRTKLPEVLRSIQTIGNDHGLRVANVFHAGDGNLHPILLYDESKPEEVEAVLQASEAILETCLALGGSLSGEHGIGVEKIGLMEKAFGLGALKVMSDVRRAFDPEARFNPNKVLPNGAGCTDTGRGLGRTKPGRQVPL